MNILNGNGWARKAKPNRVYLGSKIEMAATNHLGYEVQTLTKAGWMNLTMQEVEVDGVVKEVPYIAKKREDAESAMKTLKNLNPNQEYRVYEAVEFPVKK